MFHTAFRFCESERLEIELIFLSRQNKCFRSTNTITGIGSGIKFSVLCSLPGILFSNSQIVPF